MHAGDGIKGVDDMVDHRCQFLYGGAWIFTEPRLGMALHDACSRHGILGD